MKLQKEMSGVTVSEYGGNKGMKGGSTLSPQTSAQTMQVAG